MSLKKVKSNIHLSINKDANAKLSFDPCVTSV